MSQATHIQNTSNYQASQANQTASHQRVGTLLCETFGLEVSGLNFESNFFLLGFDSLMLIRLKQVLASSFGLVVEVEDFYGNLDSPAKLAAIIPAEQPASSQSVAASQALPVNPAAQLPLHGNRGTTPMGSAEVDSEGFARIFAQQMQTMADLMQQQLSCLSTTAAPGKNDSLAVKAVAPVRKPVEMMFLNFEEEPFTAQQKQFVAELITVYTQKTQGSKDLAQRHRAHFSDWINSVNFRASLKEMQYPLASNSSQGAFFTDLDGHRYLDLGMGYGVGFLGHNPTFVTAAIEAQLDAGYQLGPQYDLTGTIAEKLCRMTGVARVAFTNSGTEAVMAALRVARAVTQRDKVVIFSGSYHGSFDGVLVLADAHGSYPMAPGSTQGMAGDVVVLDYGVPESLERIRELGSSLAAVLVEPVQSRRPGFHPAEFLRELRVITKASGTALIFDEIITGFRICQGGAQKHYGIRADIVTYGKVIGGGMPLGVLAGEARFLDAIDGGMWQYRDNSHPGATPTMFAGTFSKHPLAMAALNAVLDHLEAEGPALQEAVNEKMDWLADQLNSYFAADHVPIRIKHFGSLFRFESFGSYDLAFKPVEMDLLFLWMIHAGVYTWERRICFLSTQHTWADLERVVQTVKDAVHTLRAGCFSLSNGPTAAAQPKSLTYPMTSHQQRLYSLCLAQRERDLYRFTLPFKLLGPLDVAAMERALNGLVAHHSGLRTSFEVEGDELVQRVHREMRVELVCEAGREEECDEIVARFLQPFQLHQVPLFRAGLFHFGDRNHLLVLDMHHLITDGLSAQILVQDLLNLYQGKSLSPRRPYSEYARWEWSYLESEQFQLDAAFWRQRFLTTPPVYRLGSDLGGVEGCEPSGVVRRRVEGMLFHNIRQLAVAQRVSSHMILLVAANLFLARVSGQEDVTLGVPTDARPEGFEGTVGLFANTLALHNHIDRSATLAAFLTQVKARNLEAYAARMFPFDHLVSLLDLPAQVGQNPVFDCLFTYEHLGQREAQVGELKVLFHENSWNSIDSHLEIEWLEESRSLELKLIYDGKRFRRGAIEAWADQLLNLLTALTNDGAAESCLDAFLQPANLGHSTRLDWWQERLAQMPERLTLATDLALPDRSAELGHCQVPCDGAVQRDLTLLALQHKVPLQTLLCAVYAQFLATYSGMRQVVVVCQSAEARQPLCLDLIPEQGGALSMGTWLARVTQVWMEAAQHVLPFNVLVNLVPDHRDVASLYQFEMCWGQQTLSSPEPNRIALRFSADPEAGSFQFHYNPSLLSPERARLMAKQFGFLLQAWSNAAPETPLRLLRLLDDGEVEAQLQLWNRTGSDHPQSDFLSTIVTQFGANQPNKTMVSLAGSDQYYSYTSMERRANQLAHHLMALGCGPERVVTVCLQRGPDMLLAMLAIFKAGGVYVPLHPKDPAERGSFLLQETGASILLTIKELAGRFPRPEACALVCLDQLETALAQAPASPPEGTLISPDQLAYMIFTSGSTGKPKGAMLSHRGMLNHLRSKVVDLDLNENDVVAQNASQSFDISVWQFLVAPLVGATTHVIPDQLAHDPIRLIGEVKAREVTILEVVPSLFQPLFSELDPSNLPPLPKLRCLLQTGEALPVALCARWLEIFPQIPIVNAYGPTECSDDVTMYRLETLGDPLPVQIPIGFPIINTEAYLVGRDMALLPLGVAGELWIGGIGVGRGYRNRPGQTAERFVPDPFGCLPGARVYRTGDLVRRSMRLAPSLLDPAPFEYLGRFDFQVKIRGYRIELSEIEYVYSQHPSIEAVVVHARKRAAADADLVAYLVARGTTELDYHELRQFAQKALPDYMVPSAFVVLETFPVTVNGKLDRAQLPDPDLFGLRPQADPDTVAQTSDGGDPVLTQELLRLWQRILKLPDLRPQDSFFEVGGNSIKAIVLTTKIQEELSLEVSLEQLFQAPSPQRLAAAIQSQHQVKVEPIPALPPASYYPCSRAQTRLWLACQLEGGSRAYSNFDAFEILGDLSTKPFEQAFLDLIQRHAIHRTTFHSIGGIPQMRVHAEMALPFDVLDLRGQAVTQADLLQRYRDEMAVPFDLETGPLLRARLLRVENQKDQPRFILFFASHHIISDGWSTDIFTRELFSAYASYVKGQAPKLPELSIQYHDYATWSNQRFLSESMQPHRAYWLSKLANMAPAPLLPCDYPRSEQRETTGQMAKFELGLELSAAIRALCRSHETTLFVFLQTVVKVWMFQRTGQEDLVIGAPFSGRVHPDLKNQIGFYLNLLPLRDVFQAQMTLSQALAAVQQTTLEANIHESYPFDAMIEDHLGHYASDRHPMFDVLVNMVNFDFLQQKNAGLDFKNLFEESAGSKVELNFVFEDHPSLLCSVEYAVSLYRSETITGFVAELLDLCQRFCQNPDQSVAERGVAGVQSAEEHSFLEAAMAIDEDF